MGQRTQEEAQSQGSCHLSSGFGRVVKTHKSGECSHSMPAPPQSDVPKPSLFFFLALSSQDMDLGWELEPLQELELSQVGTTGYKRRKVGSG